MLRLIKLAAPTVLILGLFVIFTGQQASPQTIPVFGITEDSLALDGIYVYPADANEKVTKEQAKEAAKGLKKREDKIEDMMLVNLKLPAEDFEGLAWVVKWDVDGQTPSWPGDSNLQPEQKYVYTFAITFVDAQTGRELTTLEEAGLVEPGKPAPEPLDP